MSHHKTNPVAKEISHIKASRASKCIFIALAGLTATTFLPDGHPQLYLVAGLVLATAMRLSATGLAVANLSVSITASGALIVSLTSDRIAAGNLAIHMPLLLILSALFAILATALIFSRFNRRGSRLNILSEYPPMAWKRLISTLTRDIASAGNRVRPADSKEAMRGCASSHLLLVEDLPLSQEVTVRVLESAGHTVDVVADGLEAIRAVKQNCYDAVLMDIQLPGIDGVATAERIRASAGNERNVPIVAVTANIGPAEIIRFRRSGIRAHVGKPFDDDVLLATIERVLGRLAGDDSAIVNGECGPRAEAPNIEELIKMLGSNRVTVLLRRLKEELEAAFAGNNDDYSAVAAQSHRIVSQAGLLGFTALSEAARNLEQVALAGRPIRRALETTSRHRRITCRLIDEIVHELDFHRQVAHADTGGLLVKQL